MWRQSTTLQEFATRLIVQWRHFPGRQVLFSAYAPLVVAIGGAVPISLWAYLRQQKMLMTELATAHGDTAKGETLDGLLVRSVTFTTVSRCPRELFCRSLSSTQCCYEQWHSFSLRHLFRVALLCPSAHTRSSWHCVRADAPFLSVAADIMTVACCVPGLCTDCPCHERVVSPLRLCRECCERLGVQVPRGDLITIVLHLPVDVFDVSGGRDGCMRRIVWTGSVQKTTFHARVKATAVPARYSCYADVLCGAQVAQLHFGLTVGTQRDVLAAAGVAAAAAAKRGGEGLATLLGRCCRPAENALYGVAALFQIRHRRCRAAIPLCTHVLQSTHQYTHVLRPWHSIITTHCDYAWYRRLVPFELPCRSFDCHWRAGCWPGV